MFRRERRLPNGEEFEEQTVETIIKESESQRPLHPIIKDFQQAVENNPDLKVQYSQMFVELPPEKQSQVRTYQEMFRLVNYIMLHYAPEYNETDLVGFPINAILNWIMATNRGCAAFLNEEANGYWRKVLNKWGEFLQSEASTYVLVSEEEWGWFGEKAMAAMPNFEKEFVCDPTKEHYGYTSWDDFFTRKFREGVRPITEGDNVIANACESSPYNLQHDVKMVDEFQIKKQPYSLKHMLADDSLACKFENGTVY